MQPTPPQPPRPPGSSAGPSYDTCYRHPDRRAGVRCQRCERPICPSCMTTASVGFQCPECIAAAASTAPVSRHGAAAWGLAGGGRPVATIVLIALNAVAYLVSEYGPTGNGATVFQRGVLYGPCIRSADQWYRLISGGFLHAGLLHIGMNMFALWIIGQALEPALGRARFVALYAVSLLGGSLGVMLVSPNEATVGASGAIFGLFGALLVVQMTRGINPMRSGIVTLIGLNLLITFIVPGISAGGHVGGLVTGVAAGGVLMVGRDVDVQTPGEQAARVAAVVVLGALVFVAAIAFAGRADALYPGYCP